jgi:hypothetical protein
MAGKKDAKQKRKRKAKRRSKVLKERRVLSGGAGRERPREISSSRCKNKQE